MVAMAEVMGGASVPTREQFQHCVVDRRKQRVGEGRLCSCGHAQPAGLRAGIGQQVTLEVVEQPEDGAVEIDAIAFAQAHLSDDPDRFQTIDGFDRGGGGTVQCVA